MKGDDIMLKLRKKEKKEKREEKNQEAFKELYESNKKLLNELYKKAEAS